jgi:Fe-S cluster assembly ATP-binding protein
MGEIHAIMGPNGSGKSTMSYVLSGRDGYEVTGGDVCWMASLFLKWKPMSAPVQACFWPFNIRLNCQVWRYELFAGGGECPPP